MKSNIFFPYNIFFLCNMLFSITRSLSREKIKSPSLILVQENFDRVESLPQLTLTFFCLW